MNALHAVNRYLALFNAFTAGVCCVAFTHSLFASRIGHTAPDFEPIARRIRLIVILFGVFNLVAAVVSIS